MDTLTGKRTRSSTVRRSPKAGATNPRVVAVGVMSGTSCDGIDAVLVDLASVERPHEPRVLAHAYRPYPDGVRRALLRPEVLTTREIAELHYLLSELYARTARAVDPLVRASVCGLHGQTIWHAPHPSSPACTLQIGSSAVLAQRLGIPVVGDLRGADVAWGGQGAPIVPFAHWFFTPKRLAPRLVVNFGGICNVTYVAEDARDVVAYDVGPGMILSDAWARRLGRACDRGGVLSRRGTVIDALVREIAAHPFVRKRPPKSTGREAFGADFFEALFRRWSRADARDVARSLLAATAEILARTVRRDARIGRFSEILLSGGGAKNPVLVHEVAARFGRGAAPSGRGAAPSSAVRISVALEGVFAPQNHECAAMALIAARTLRGLPSSLPRVTGARTACILGHVHAPTIVTRR
jgi:anhydro-N-acetylmuramic acid kinase